MIKSCPQCLQESFCWAKLKRFQKGKRNILPFLQWGQRPAAIPAARDTGLSLDCEVGDYISLPKNSILEGVQLEILENDNGCFLKTRVPGLAKATNESLGLSIFIRVSPKNYKGRSCYRFEEDVQE